MTRLFWWEMEADGYVAPIRKVKAPRLNHEPMEPISLEYVQELLRTCHSDYYGVRDRAIILILIDPGVRAQALLDVNLDDLNVDTGTIRIISK